MSSAICQLHGEQPFLFSQLANAEICLACTSFGFYQEKIKQEVLAAYPKEVQAFSSTLRNLDRELTIRIRIKDPIQAEQLWKSAGDQNILVGGCQVWALANDNLFAAVDLHRDYLEYLDDNNFINDHDEDFKEFEDFKKEWEEKRDARVAEVRAKRIARGKPV